MDALGANLARQATETYARSALPSAPVVRDGPPAREPWRAEPGPLRRAVAGGLRRLANRLEPGTAIQ